MRKLIAALSFIFLAMSTYASVDTSWFYKGCKQFEGNWHLVHDDEAEAITKELLDRAGIMATPVVCSSTENPLDHYPYWESVMNVLILEHITPLFSIKPEQAARVYQLKRV